MAGRIDRQTYLGVHQVQYLGLLGQSKMLSVSDLAYGIKRATTQGLTTKSFVI